MILTALIRRQLWIFGILTAIALYLMTFTYARVPAMLGIGVYHVKADFRDASGLYPSALVTFHGVKVGQVSSMDLSANAAVATLQLQSGTSIPRNVDAQIHSTSAIGEQYVDLVPSGSAPGNLKDGDILGLDRTVDMPQITPVLESLNHLLASVPLKATTVVLNQVNGGLGSEGSNVGELITASSQLVTTANQQIASTSSLISTLQPLLSTQNSLASSTLAYSKSLNELTSQLAAHRTDIASLLTNGTTGFSQISPTIRDLGRNLPTLLSNVNVVGQVLNTYLPNLQQILVVYPATVARLEQAVNPRASEGDVQLDLRVGVDNPPACTTGYVAGSAQRSPSDTSLRSVNPLAHCSVAPSNPSSVRGARNLPCPNSAARGPLPSSCGLRFGNGTWPTGYSSSWGNAATSASTSTPGTGGTAWEQLFLGPLGM